MRRAWVVPAGRAVLSVALLAALATGAARSPRVLDLTDVEAAPPSAAPVGDGTLEESSVVCVGPELSGLKGAPDIPQQVTLTAESAPPSLTGATAAGGGITITATGGPPATGERAAATTVSAPVPVVVEGKGASAPGLSSLQTFSAATSDLRGLVTLPCTAPVAEAWLVAGGGAPGRQERLVLANPGANEVTVDVDILDATGPVASDAGRGIVVPGRGRASVLVDAVAPAAAAPVVHVSARGGAVVAALDDAWLDGSIPAGLESTTPAAPGTTVVVPIADLGQAGVLRLAVPGDAPAVASIRMLSPTGPSPLADGVRTLAARTTVDIPLSGLPAGSHALEVTADVPVVAAVMSQARAEGAPGDIAWTPATPPVTGVSGIPLPAVGDGAVRQLALVGAGSTAAAVVVLRTASGEERREVGVDPDRLTLVDLGAASSVWVKKSEGGDLHAAVLTTVGTGPARLLAVAPLADLQVTGSITRARATP